MSGHTKAKPKHPETAYPKEKLNPPNGFDKFCYNPNATRFSDPRNIIPV